LVCKVHGVTGGQVEIECDGLSALQQSFNPDNIPNAPTAPPFNLICAISRVTKQCPVVWLSCHVDGHQDKDLTAILDRHALLNIETDTVFKAIMLLLPQTVGSDQVQYKIFGEPWSIWLGFKKLSKCFRPNIKEIRHGMSLCQKWESKERFVFLASVNNIDWQPNHMAIKNSIVSRRRIGKAWDVAWDHWEHRNRILHRVDQGTCKVSTPKYVPSTHKAQRFSLVASEFVPDLTLKPPSCGSSHTQCVAKTSLCGARTLVTTQKMEGFNKNVNVKYA